MPRLLLLFIFGLNLSVYAQDSLNYKPKEATAKWCIDLATGPCFPLGDYASRNPDNPRAGYSMVGLSSKLTVSFGVGKNLNVMARGIWFYNPVEPNSLLNAYANTHPSSTYDSYKIVTNAWKNYGLLAGIGKGFAFNEISLELKGLIGILQGTYSDFSVNQVDFDTNTTETINYGGDKVFQLAMNVGFDFKTRLNNFIGLSLGGDYLATEMRFNKLFSEASNGTKTNLGSYSQSVSVFQLSAGLYVIF